MFFQNLYVELTSQLMQSKLKPVRWYWARIDFDPYEGTLMKLFDPFTVWEQNKNVASLGQKSADHWPVELSKVNFCSLKLTKCMEFFVIDV